MKSPHPLVVACHSWEDLKIEEYFEPDVVPPVPEEQILAAYVDGLVDRFYNVVHVVDQPLWNGYTQFQLASVAELADIKADRLYSSRATAAHMTWYATHQREEGSICHPSYAEAWKHFDQMYPNFVEELRNIRLGLCIDGFAPHGQYILIHVGLLSLHCAISPWNKKAFTKNRVENKVARPSLTEDQILDWVADISHAVEILVLLPSDYGSNQKWMKKIIF
ncbi:hypothetical protein Sango_2480100 [Sesamum angolense]|uniref:Transposase n=1 Tax=Sesamum angolense TaxID=2727404 RepID=A0AAE1W3H0_9LAMI|nr:hypothetical protein Sango_2480100 [Sesamum angolense]